MVSKMLGKFWKSHYRFLVSFHFEVCLHGKRKIKRWVNTRNEKSKPWNLWIQTWESTKETTVDGMEKKKAGEVQRLVRFWYTKIWFELDIALSSHSHSPLTVTNWEVCIIWGKSLVYPYVKTSCMLLRLDGVQG
jgi:hypothetical protein